MTENRRHQPQSRLPPPVGVTVQSLLGTSRITAAGTSAAFGTQEMIIVMPIAMHHDSTNVFRLQISGTLRKAELDRCQDALVAEMNRIGPVRLLFVLQGFEGWEPTDDWSDLSFYVKHGDRIERIAFVGDERWRTQMLMFSAADLRKAPVEFFPAPAAEDALAWLTEPA